MFSHGCSSHLPGKDKKKEQSGAALSRPHSELPITFTEAEILWAKLPLHRHHYLWKLKRTTIFLCVCWLLMENITNPERIKNLADVNSVIISGTAMPYGLWQGSPPTQGMRKNNRDARSLYSNFAKSLPSLQLSVECRDCILPACRLSEATCQDGAQSSMYM